MDQPTRAGPELREKIEVTEVGGEQDGMVRDGRRQDRGIQH